MSKLATLAIVLGLVFLPGIASAAIYEDNFDRADAGDGGMGADWGATDRAQMGIISNQAAPNRTDVQRSAKYVAHVADGLTHTYAKLSLDFLCVASGATDDVPRHEIGINYGNASGADLITIWGYSKALLSVDGGGSAWLMGLNLTVGDWYRAIVEQNGSTITYTIEQLDGTDIASSSLTSTKTVAGGNAYFMADSFWAGAPSGGYTSAFDNFKFELTPEPVTLTILALGGLGALIRRRR